MANDMVKERIILDQKIGKETTQLLLEGDIIVPDIKPDMAVILQTDAKLCIDRTEISTDRINFMGRLDIQVLYLAKGGDKPVHSMSTSMPIDDFINMDGVRKDMWVEVSDDICNIDYRMLNDRKISCRAVINVTVSAQCQNQHEVVVNISDIPVNQILKSRLELNRGIENKLDRAIIRDEITLPSVRPNIREVLQSEVSVLNKDVRVGSSKVTVNGELLLTLLYRGDNESSMIEFTEHEIPFNQTVDVVGARDDMIADVMLTVQDKYLQVRPDADGEDRVLEIEVSLGMAVKVSCQETIEVLEDAYCINKFLDISKTPIKYPKLICRNRNQSPIKEIVQVDGNCPDILQIFRVKGKAALDDIKVIDDKVIAEGAIEADILYLAQNDDTPLYCFKKMLAYRQVIETKGAAPDMEVAISVSIEHVAFNMLSGRELELRFLLSFNTQVVQEKTGNMITDIEFRDIDRESLDKMASMTVYVIQPGDTLWKIAKRYNTSIDDIASVNDIENTNKVVPGQKLLILKKIAV